MTAETEDRRDFTRYAPLGLIGNPFALPENSSAPVSECEIGSKSNELLKAIVERSREDAPKPLWIDKGVDIPSYYFMAAVAGAESVMAKDDAMNVAYAVIELYTMRSGVTRSTLRLVSERLSFREFDRTLAAYIGPILATPDTSLPSYQVMGPDRLDAFAARFEEDPIAAVHDYLGTMEDERRPELAEIVDYRPLELDEDVAGETDVTVEVDSTITDLPGTAPMLPEPEEEASDDDVAAVRDYLIEYTSTHLSTVIARALRVFHDRGLIAMSGEFRVTKAPRKTLAAVTSLARARFRKVALIFDGFDQWLEVDADIRSRVAGSMSEMRWKLAGDAFLVFLVEPGTAPELDETFRGNDVLDWSFSELGPLQEARDTLDTDVVDRWLSAASLDSSHALTTADPVLTAVAEASGGSFVRFISLAGAAGEDAVRRGVETLDDASLQAALASESQE